MRKRLLNILLGAAFVCGPGAVCAQNLQRGDAAFYASNLHGRTTASGEIYDHGNHTAAHGTLPFGTYVKVTNLINGASTKVRINDRYNSKDRIISLSQAAAHEIGMLQAGVAPVQTEVVPPPKKPFAGIAKIFSGSREVQISGQAAPKRKLFSPRPSESQPQNPVASGYAKHSQAVTSQRVPSHSYPNSTSQKDSYSAYFPYANSNRGEYTPPPIPSNQNSYGSSNATAQRRIAAPSTQANVREIKPAVNRQDNSGGAIPPPPIPATSSAVARPKPAYSQQDHSPKRVQFGAFGNHDNAVNTARIMQSRGVPVEIAPRDSRGNYRVISTQRFHNESAAQHWIGSYTRHHSGERPVVVR